ncbi:hypothetical protein JBP901_gp171 [Bacillus phage JBP901]|uniref:Uncharacterized protein n=1 Tax=Bacillus phage JBP901 TaxID=1498212 RepID=A0A0E3DEV1_9CAUD|nr:hypothetical protein JBP901_gp171 [Bacillus phage JBP901]AID17883.1 hypothetical protein JBP901_gp171 [Bacillus phage JBP901]ANY29406.1 hypothetical protein [Bacillus phage PK16]
MTIRKPLDLVRFVSSVPVLPDGTIPLNEMGNAPQYVSTLYTPSFSVSALARLTLDDIKQNKVELINVPLDPRTIVAQVMDSDLATYNPRVYVLVCAVVLESFALLYSIEQTHTSLQYVTKKDILKIKQNINYISDYFGTERKYRKMIETLRDIDISIGYLENQVESIMNRWVVR